MLLQHFSKRSAPFFWKNILARTSDKHLTMNTKNLRCLKRPGSEKKRKHRRFNLVLKEERSHVTSQKKLPFFLSCFAKTGFNIPLFPPLFRLIRSNSLRRNDAKDNPTRTFCTICFKRDVSTPNAKLRLQYCFQNKVRFFESKWTKGFFGKADKTINNRTFKMDVFYLVEAIRALQTLNFFMAK